MQLALFLNEYFKGQKLKLQPWQIEKLSVFFKYKKVNKNNFILQKTDQNVPLYIVIKGVLRIFDINLQGRECTCDFLMEQQCGTLLAYFISKSAAVGYVETLEDTEYLYIFKEDLEELISKWPELYCWYSQLLESTIVQWALRSNTYQNSLFSAAERYELFLKDQPLSHILQNRLSDKMIASFLQMSAETFSRLKAEKY